MLIFWLESKTFTSQSSNFLLNGYRNSGLDSSQKDIPLSYECNFLIPPHTNPYKWRYMGSKKRPFITFKWTVSFRALCLSQITI